MPPVDPNPLENFFACGEQVIRRYLTSQEGQYIVECKNQPNDGGKRRFKLIAYDSLQDSIYCTPAHLEDYQLRRQSQVVLNAIDKPFSYLEEGVLEVLKRTGHGHVNLEFERSRKGTTVLICSVTFSHRCVV